VDKPKADLVIATYLDSSGVDTDSDFLLRFMSGVTEIDFMAEFCWSVTYGMSWKGFAMGAAHCATAMTVKDSNKIVVIDLTRTNHESLEPSQARIRVRGVVDRTDRRFSMPDLFMLRDLMETGPEIGNYAVGKKVFQFDLTDEWIPVPVTKTGSDISQFVEEFRDLHPMWILGDTDCQFFVAETLTEFVRETARLQGKLNVLSNILTSPFRYCLTHDGEDTCERHYRTDVAKSLRSCLGQVDICSIIRDPIRLLTGDDSDESELDLESVPFTVLLRQLELDLSNMDIPSRQDM